MRKLGCLVVIVLVCAAIYLFVSSPGLSDEEKAQMVGQKVHRGWNEVQKYARSVKEGWKSVDEQPPEADKPQEP